MNSNHSLSRSYIICFAAYLFAVLVAGLALLAMKKSGYGGNVLAETFVADIAATLGIFLFSVIFKNSSLYDAYWSVVPPFIAYGWWRIFPGESLVGTLFLVAILFWAVRLTYNWMRGWTGLGHEDWRYKMLHDKNPSIYWLTNLGGIHLFPTVMVFLGLLPVYYAFYQPQELNSWLLYVGFAIAVIATIIELVADEQMRTFKRAAKPNEFIKTGLWRYSRHPNYFGEISFWFGLWMMMMAVAPDYWWSAIGFVAMTIMFLFASIPMMEEKNKKNKKGFEEYTNKVSVLIPLPSNLD
jgi:steroid 5-alpha reductase family enzyme